MTIEQITAINNAMSMLSDISQIATGTNSVEGFEEYINSHIKALENSEVDTHIIEHYKTLCDSWMPIVKQSVANIMRYESLNEEFYSTEDYIVFSNANNNLLIL